jgi:His/Glu/Gln/Arg/opine family amino acid ABC transporter permease subunit
VRSDKFEVKLVDENDEEVPVGQVGELVVRPKLPWIVMAGYWKRPVDTVAAWRNLWLHSGDLLRRDESGYYYFVDRLKDSIRRRGRTSPPSRWRRPSTPFPRSSESAVIPVASEFTEQEVLACVAFRPGMRLELADLHARIASTLPPVHGAAIPSRDQFRAEDADRQAAEVQASGGGRSHFPLGRGQKMTMQAFLKDAAEFMPVLLAGVGVTLKVTALSLVLSTAIGLVLALMRLSPVRWVSGAAFCVIATLRGIPISSKLLYIYFVFPRWASS